MLIWRKATGLILRDPEEGLELVNGLNIARNICKNAGIKCSIKDRILENSRKNFWIEEKTIGIAGRMCGTAGKT